MIEKIVERVTGLLLRPDETWAEIRDEETSVAELYREYLVVSAGLPAVAGFLGALFSGANFFAALAWGILYYVFSLVGVWIVVKVLGFLAKNFRIVHDEISLYKLVSYSYTIFFIAGIFFLIPFLYWLAISGVYGFYLFFIGCSHFFECPKEEKFTFLTLSVITIIFSLVFVFALAGAISNIDVIYLKM